MSEHFYPDNYHDYDKYIVSKKETCYFDNYSVTIEEYMLDYVTGVGMIKCSMHESDYVKYNQSISPYVDEKELLSYQTIDTIENEGIVYFYYRFILNDGALDKDKCTLYFNRMNLFEKYELEYTNTISSEFVIDSESTIIYSPFGFVANKDISIDGFDKYIEVNRIQNVIKDIYCSKDSTKSYKVYLLQYPIAM